MVLPGPRTGGVGVAPARDLGAQRFGVVRTQVLHAHDPEALCTKVTRWSYADAASTGAWEHHLELCVNDGRKGEHLRPEKRRSKRSTPHRSLVLLGRPPRLRSGGSPSENRRKECSP